MSKQTGGDEVEATEMNKGHKAPGKKPFVTQALTEIPLSDQSSTSECSEEKAEILTTIWLHYFHSPTQSYFVLIPFRRLRKSPCLSGQPLLFPIVATTQTPKVFILCQEILPPPQEPKSLEQ